MRIAMMTLLTGLLAAPLLGGCGDRTVKESQTTSTNPITGTTTTEDQTTHQRSDGSTYTDTQTHKSD